jgi:hypothetical protein
VISKSLGGRSQLTKLNTYAQAEGPTSAHYFNMHIARLLCQVFLHWEFLPFLPLRFSQPEGLHRLQFLCHGATQPPLGFWTSSARECFNAARSILDLAADARETGSLPMNAFALYGIFVAKFMEVYAKAFPWMDPDFVEADRSPQPDAYNQCPPLCLSLRPHLSFAAEIEGANEILHVAEQWVNILDSITKYFETFKQDFIRNLGLECASVQKPKDVGFQMSKCLRDGGYGEGHEEYELFRHRLCDFGRL